ncbi:MAG: N-acetylmannosamine-6-phosphate 2-epimerase [bacterium]|nr:N-acetylmannosamine-6-phosphate 2-epimerase [bacterium]
MNEVLGKIKNKIIVSVQAMPSEPLYDEVCINALIKSVINGGAAGLRVAGVRDVKNAKKLADVPVIGITKPSKIPSNYKELVYITPTIKDAASIIDAGADIVAFDATFRNRGTKENILQIINFIHSKGRLAMADISTFEEGIINSLLGADIISTTLSGYTTYSEKNSSEPDFELAEKLSKTIDVPIILEGRIWSPEEVTKAFDSGAFSVVIGSAITRPQLITKRFVKAAEQL